MADRSILPIVYNGMYSLFKTYYKQQVVIAKPVLTSVLPSEGDVISSVCFDSTVKGSLMLESPWETVKSLFSKLAGSSPVVNMETLANANTEFLNMPVGIVKRYYLQHHLPFTFSLPDTNWQGRQHSPAACLSGMIYKYKVEFESFLCSVVLLLQDENIYYTPIK